MTHPDFRALCANLIYALDSGIPAARIRMSPLADRARTALAEPQQGAPTMPASVESLPLWRVLERAHEQEAGSMIDHLGNTVLGEPDRYTRAAEIEALRDWLLPEEPEPSAYDGRPRYEQRHIIWTHNRKLRAALTEQARIAREGK